MANFITAIVSLITTTISRFGYGGIILAMATESASIPLPSEVIMPFAGFLVSQHQLAFWPTVTAGAFGCLLGSIFSWFLGRQLGEELLRLLIRRYGRFALIFEYEFDDALQVFRRYGNQVIFLSRLLPVVRTFISLPAGIAEMPLFKFSLYTFSGSFLWTLLLTWLGIRLGENWSQLGPWFHRFDAIIGVGLLLLVVWYPWHKIRKQKRYQERKKQTVPHLTASN